MTLEPQSAAQLEREMRAKTDAELTGILERNDLAPSLKARGELARRRAEESKTMLMWTKDCRSWRSRCPDRRGYRIVCMRPLRARD